MGIEINAGKHVDLKPFFQENLYKSGKKKKCSCLDTCLDFIILSL